MTLDAGLDCGGTADGAPHFYCFGCLSSTALARAGPRLVAGLLCAGRLGGEGCDAPPYVEVALARGLSAVALAAVKEGQLRAQKIELEASFLEREAALKRELAEARARVGDVEQLRLHVIEELRTPKCPRCKHAFVGFNGCFALQCAPDDGDAGANAAAWAAAFCGAAFCAWCFADCGDDAHGHVRACPHNTTAGGGHFGTVEAFDGSLRALRLRRLRAYLPTLQPQQLRGALLAALRTDLEDLGLAGAPELAPL